MAPLWLLWQDGGMSMGWTLLGLSEPESTPEHSSMIADTSFRVMIPL